LNPTILLPSNDSTVGRKGLALKEKAILCSTSKKKKPGQHNFRSGVILQKILISFGGQKRDQESNHALGRESWGGTVPDTAAPESGNGGSSHSLADLESRVKKRGGLFSGKKGGGGGKSACSEAGGGRICQTSLT